ncbi:class I SAM-dependent methyltransferase [Candidatus Saccharibacteria bacterium]|nr:class I SAM-dependent methyltransferase [Candidatus Saccharibacteria bacterium]
MDSPVWDKIYKDYQKGGPAWATLEGGLEPHFKQFIKKTELPKKNAFDIGYGTGRYLQFLKLKGFSVSGIDSSETAYQMAKNAVSDADLMHGDMYNLELPKSSFGLILSISTIHHGTKAQVKKVLDEVYGALLERGYTYITLPINDSSNQWITFKDKDEIEPGTYAPNSGPEKGLAHSFYTKEEVEKLFQNYKNLSIDKIEGRWHITAQK